MIHLICGPIGAGKTTIAHQIAEQYGAIRFSEDEWLSKLFIPDAPQDLMSCSDDIISAWATEKYQRCRGQIWLLCERLLSLGVPVVLDGAAATKEQRDAFRKKRLNVVLTSNSTMSLLIQRREKREYLKETMKKVGRIL